MALQEVIHRKVVIPHNRAAIRSKDILNRAAFRNRDIPRNRAAIRQPGYQQQQGYPQGDAGYGGMNVMGGAPMGDTLLEGQSLTGMQAISSRSGMFHAVMQNDNNFVIYKSPHREFHAKHAIWDSKTCGRGSNGRLILQVGIDNY